MTFLNRWQHTMTLTLRVWPREIRAHKLSVLGKEWSVDGMTFNVNEKLEVVHRLGEKGFAAWELSNEDAETLMAAGTAGAKVGAMRVRCPGTMAETNKKECWLDVDVTVYPEANDRKFTAASVFTREVICPEDEIEGRLRQAWARSDEWVVTHVRRTRSKERAAAFESTYEPRTFSGFVLMERAPQIDVAAVARHILAGKVVLFRSQDISAKTLGELRSKLNYYTVPGRKPEEDGGLFRGYQLGDGVVRWRWRCKAEDREANKVKVLQRMHKATRDKGQANRRTYFIGEVVERIAKQYGVSRQRVMARFLDEGIVDFLFRSYEAAVAKGRIKIHSQPEVDLRGFVSEAVRVVSFIIDGLGKKGAA